MTAAEGVLRDGGGVTEAYYRVFLRWPIHTYSTLEENDALSGRLHLIHYLEKEEASRYWKIHLALRPVWGRRHSGEQSLAYGNRMPRIQWWPSDLRYVTLWREEEISLEIVRDVRDVTEEAIPGHRRKEMQT